MRSSFLARGLAVARKDWVSEARSFSGLAATGLFSLVTLAAVSIAIGPFGATADVNAALLWVVLLFAGLSGLGHGFAREVDARTAPHLKLLAGPHEIWLGKSLFNLGLLVCVELWVVPLYLAVMAPPVKDAGALLATLALADVGLAAVATLLAAIVAQTRARGALLAGLAIPVLMPWMIAAIGGTKAAFGVTAGGAGAELVTLVSFDAVMIGASVLLIEPVWTE